MARPKKQHLKKRPDGRYACYYHGKFFYGYTEEEALRAREEYKQAEASGNIYRPDVKVLEYALKWLPVARPTVSDATYRGLSCHLEKLARALQNRPIVDVKPTEIKEVFSKEYYGLSNKYILNAKQLFTEMFDAAVSDGIIQRNPCREKAALPHKGTTGSHRPITEQERYWIENLCLDHRAHAAAMTMLWSGVRPQEVKAMKVEDCIDFDNDIITLSEFVHLDGYVHYKVTTKGKNDLAARQIPLFSPLKKTLKGKSGYIAPSANGKLVSVRAWRCLWLSYKAAMEKAINGCDRRWYGKTKAHKAMLAKGEKLPPYIEFTVVPYDLRHSFCVYCRDHGVELNTCIKWMGHSDSQMILKIYDDVSDRRSSSEAERLEEAISSENSAPIYNGAAGSHRPITDQERQWIENLCLDHGAHAAAMTMLWAGVRPQEVKVMKVEDCIDFDNNVITLPGKGKNDPAARQIPLFSPLRKTLEGMSGYIVPSPDGKLISAHAWRSLWLSYKAAMEKAINGCDRRWYGKTTAHKAMLAEGKELPPYIEFTVVPYDLCHSFCVFCRDHGVYLNTCIKWMGQDNSQMIWNIYDAEFDSRSATEAANIEKAIALANH